MTVWKSIILGIVQGLTEFLPISSSGHLVIVQKLLGVNDHNALFFATMLHIGTLLSIFFVYGKDIIFLLREFFKMLYEVATGKGIRLENDYRKLGLFVILATIPTAIIGLAFNDLFEALFQGQLFIGFALLVTGFLLWFAEKWASEGKNIKRMRPIDAIIIGVFQAFAITPGISRSGSTIVGSLIRGLNKELTVKFSFLISIPAILGAAVLEIKDAAVNGMGGTSLFMILLGMLSAALSGFIAIKAMISFIKRKKLHYFSYYTWIVGLSIIFISFWHS